MSGFGQKERYILKARKNIIPATTSVYFTTSVNLALRRGVTHTAFDLILRKSLIVLIVNFFSKITHPGHCLQFYTIYSPL